MDAYGQPVVDTSGGYGQQQPHQGGGYDGRTVQSYGGGKWTLLTSGKVPEKVINVNRCIFPFLFCDNSQMRPGTIRTVT